MPISIADASKYTPAQIKRLFDEHETLTERHAATTKARATDQLVAGLRAAGIAERPAEDLATGIVSRATFNEDGDLATLDGVRSSLRAAVDDGVSTARRLEADGARGWFDPEHAKKVSAGAKITTVNGVPMHDGRPLAELGVNDLLALDAREQSAKAAR